LNDISASTISMMIKTMKKMAFVTSARIAASGRPP